MKINYLNRRRFIDLSSKFMLSLPVAYSISCIPDRVTLLNPEDSLKKLIFVLGPWPDSDKQKADKFVKRFMKAEPLVGSYLPEFGEIIQNLANRFPDETMAIKEINLKKLPAREQELLIGLGQQLYSFVEVRFYISNIPSWGECQGNEWHTRTPVEGKN